MKQITLTSKYCGTHSDNMIGLKLLFSLFLSILAVKSSFGQNYYSVGSNSNYSFKEITELSFKPNDGQINYGFSFNYAYHKIDFDKTGVPEKAKFLHFLNHLVDSTTIYLQNDYKESTVFHHGLEVKESASIHDFGLVFEIPNNTQVIYIKEKGSSFYWQDIQLIDFRTIQSKIALQMMFNGGVLMVLVMLSLWNLVLFVRNHYQAHIYYSIYFVFLLFMLLYMTGFGESVLWSNWYLIKDKLEGIFISGMIVFYSLFAMVVLNVRQLSWRLFTLLFASVILGNVLFVLTIAGVNHIMISKLANMIPVYTMLVILISTVVSWRRGNSVAALFLIGWTSFFIGSTIRILSNYGIIEANVFSLNAPLFGVLVEAIVFTILVSRYVEIENNRRQKAIQQFVNQTVQLKQALSNVENEPEINIEQSVNLQLKAPLSKREIEVLRELSKNHSYAEIAENLFVSKNTIKTHISKIYYKLGASNREEAIEKADKLNI